MHVTCSKGSDMQQNEAASQNETKIIPCIAGRPLSCSASLPFPPRKLTGTRFASMQAELSLL
jgi:hypothetical protein